MVGSNELSTQLPSKTSTSAIHQLLADHSPSLVKQDDYILGQQVGKGAFGTAHIVTHKVDGLRYVLKRVRLARQSHRERQASLQELCLLSSLNHRNILQYKESWVEAGCVVCMVVELCSSADLMAQLQLRITAAVYFNEEHLHDMVVQLASAFHMLHVNRIAHRDVKSSNILITGDGCLKLADFGLSTLLDSSDSLTDTVVGTPSYMGPELMQERPYGVKNDMWGLGCVLYELAALKPAFQAFNMSGLVRKITTGPTPMVPSRYSPEFKALIRALLCKEAEGRPSAAQVLQLPWLQPASVRVEAKFGPALQEGYPIKLPCIGPLPADIAKLEAELVIQEKAAVLVASEAKTKRLAAQVKFGPKMGPQPPPPPITSQAPSPSPSPTPTPHVRQATRPGIYPLTRRSSTNNPVTINNNVPPTAAIATKETPTSVSIDASPRPLTGNLSGKQPGPRPRYPISSHAAPRNTRQTPSAGLPPHTFSHPGTDPAGHIVQPPDRAGHLTQKHSVLGNHMLESHSLVSPAQQARKSISAPPTLLCAPEPNTFTVMITPPYRPVALSPIPRPSPATPTPGQASTGFKCTGNPAASTPARFDRVASVGPGLDHESPAQPASGTHSPPPLTLINPSPINADFPHSRSASPSPSPSPTATYTTLLRSFPPTPSPLADFARAAHPFFRCKNEPVNLQPLTAPTCILQPRPHTQTLQTQSRPLRVHTLSPQERTASHYSLLLPPSPSSDSPTPNPSPSPMRLFTPRHSTLLLTHTLDRSPMTIGSDFGSCFGSVIGSGLGSGLNSGSTNSSRLSIARPTSAPPDSPSSTSHATQPPNWDSRCRITPSPQNISSVNGGTAVNNTRLQPLHFLTHLQNGKSRSSTACSPRSLQQRQHQLQQQDQQLRRSGGSSYTELISGGSSGRAGLFRSHSSSLSSPVSSLSSLCCSPHTRGGPTPSPVAATAAASALSHSELSDLEEEEGALNVDCMDPASPLESPHARHAAILAAAAIHAHAHATGGSHVNPATGSSPPLYACPVSSGLSTEAEAAALAASQRLKLLQQQQYSQRGRVHTSTCGVTNSPYGTGERVGRGRVVSSSSHRSSATTIVSPLRPTVRTSTPSTASPAIQNGHAGSSPRAIYSKLVSLGRASLTAMPRAMKGGNGIAPAAVSAAVAAGNADVYKYVTDPEGQPHIGNGIQPYVHL